jgi:hypothetical protein
MLRWIVLVAAASAAVGVVSSAAASSGPTVAQIKAAVATHSNNFVLANAYAYGGQAPGHGWIDVTTGGGRWVSANGKSVILTSVSPAPHDPTLVVVADTNINYTTRTWYRTQLEEPARIFAPSSIANPTAAISQGVQFLGVERVDGRQTYHLRSTQFVDSPNGPARVDIWLSTNQDYVIRQTRTTRAGNVIQRIDNYWLPRTSANLALATMAIPSGFKQVSAPAKP